MLDRQLGSMAATAAKQSEVQKLATAGSVPAQVVERPSMSQMAPPVRDVIALEMAPLHVAGAGAGAAGVSGQSASHARWQVPVASHQL